MWHHESASVVFFDPKLIGVELYSMANGPGGADRCSVQGLATARRYELGSDPLEAPSP